MSNGQRVLVTGASGFIAMHTIIQLLEAGYTVVGTVRSTSKAEALKTTLGEHTELANTLEIAEANLSSDEGWSEAMAGCHFVQHIASPIPTTVPKDPNELIIPARDGALRVLKAAKDNGVNRVVMTSSMAAVAYGWGKDRPEVCTEEHWSNPDNLKDNTSYTRSKTIAERAAWDFVNSDEGAGLQLTTINPSAVLGPVLSGDFSASVEIVTQLMSGKLPATPNVGFQIVDVRDVAAAHVAAMTNPDAIGKRFLVADDFYWFGEVADVLREAFPSYQKKLPKGKMPDFLLKLIANVNPPIKQVLPELGKRRVTSADQAKRILGWKPRPAKDAIIASGETLMSYGVV